MASPSTPSNLCMYVWEFFTESRQKRRQLIFSCGGQAQVGIVGPIIGSGNWFDSDLPSPSQPKFQCALRSPFKIRRLLEGLTPPEQRCKVLEIPLLKSISSSARNRFARKISSSQIFFSSTCNYQHGQIVSWFW